MPPLANPNPAAYGPYDLGLFPQYMQLAQALGQNLEQARRRRAEEMAQKEAARREEAIQRIRYGGYVNVPPSTYQSQAELPGPSMERAISAGLRPQPMAEPAFGRAGLAAGLPSYEAPPSGIPTVPVTRTAPGGPMFVPGIEQQKLSLREEEGQRLGEYRDILANLAGQRLEETRRHNLEAEKLVGERMSSVKRGEITPAQKAARIDQILRDAQYGGFAGEGALSPRDLNILGGILALSEGDARRALTDPRTPPAVMPPLRRAIQYLYETPE